MRNDDALTAEEVAELLQVSRSSVYKLVKADELASYQVGRKMRFTMRDVENYIARSRQAQAARAAALRAGDPRQAPGTSGPSIAAVSQQAPAAPGAGARGGEDDRRDPFVLAGNDVLGDLLANYLGATGLVVERVYEGSYDALVDAYRGRAHAALIHLFDGETASYNVPYVSRLMPGMPVRVVRLVRRRQGLIVAKGNPKGLRGWDDLMRADVHLINRERGSGSRILLDEQLARRDADRTRLAGYDREARSALAMASYVARGAADVGIGVERAFRQVEGVDFLPLQDEWLDVALARSPQTQRAVEAISQLARTRPFREEVGIIAGYDASRMGEVVLDR